MSADKISDDRLLLTAIRAARIAHRTDVSPTTGNITGAYAWSCQCGDRSPASDFGSVHYEARLHENEAISSAVLAALVGRILPTGGEERIEESWSHGDGTDCTNDTCYDRRKQRRRVIEWPERSEWDVLMGPWVNVEEGS